MCLFAQERLDLPNTTCRGRACLRDGSRKTFSELENHVAYQNADLEYDPDAYPSLLEPMIQGKADVVYGLASSRQSSASGTLFLAFPANRFLTLLSNCLTN